MTRSDRKFAFGMCLLIVVIVMVISSPFILSGSSSSTMAVKVPVSQKSAFRTWLDDHAKSTPIYELNSWKEGDQKVILEGYNETGAACTAVGVITVDLKSDTSTDHASGNMPPSCMGAAQITKLAGFTSSVDLYINSLTAPTGFTECGQIDFAKTKGVYNYDTAERIDPLCGQYAMTVRWAK